MTATHQGKMMMLMFDKTIVVMHQKYRSKWRTIHCCGCSKWKRRKDGSCKHERQVLENLLPEIKRLHG